MADLRFNEEGNEYRASSTRRTAPGAITSWIIRAGLASNRRQAEYVLMCVAGILVALTAVLVWPEREETAVDPSNGTDQRTAIIVVE